jgi:hypothetical protein
LTVRIIGLNELNKAFTEIKANIENVEIVTSALADLMRQYVHVISGDLQASVGYQESIAYADTVYAGIEEERGGSHAYGTQAIESFDVESYADKVVEPF